MATNDRRLSGETVVDISPHIIVDPVVTTRDERFYHIIVTLSFAFMAGLFIYIIITSLKNQPNMAVAVKT